MDAPRDSVSPALRSRQMRGRVRSVPPAPPVVFGVRGTGVVKVSAGHVGTSDSTGTPDRPWDPTRASAASTATGPRNRRPSDGVRSGSGEGPPDAAWLQLEAPQDDVPGEVGMSPLVRRDPLEGRSLVRVRCRSRSPFEPCRRQSFVEPPVAVRVESQPHDLGPPGPAPLPDPPPKEVRDRRERCHGAPTQRVRGSGVPDLVEGGAVAAGNQRRRRTERHELQGQLGERGDGRVLGAGREVVASIVHREQKFAPPPSAAPQGAPFHNHPGDGRRRWRRGRRARCGRGGRPAGRSGTVRRARRCHEQCSDGGRREHGPAARSADAASCACVHRLKVPPRQRWRPATGWPCGAS